MKETGYDTRMRRRSAVRHVPSSMPLLGSAVVSIRSSRSGFTTTRPHRLLCERHLHEDSQLVERRDGGFCRLRTRNLPRRRLLEL